MSVCLNVIFLSVNFLFTKASLSGTEDFLASSQNSSIFFVLWLCILVSLYGTFYLKATPVHKVIALLLLSVFTVFLWMYVTQFLFIYLVYILAFVGAVLMLFLSVVLMLPISTVNYSSASALVLFSTWTALRPPGMESINHEFSWSTPELFSGGFWFLILIFVCSYYFLTHCWYYFFDSSYASEWEGWTYFCIKAFTDYRLNPLSKFMLHERYVFKSTLTTPILVWLWNDQPLPFQFKSYNSPVLLFLCKVLGVEDFNNENPYSPVLNWVLKLVGKYILLISFLFIFSKKLLLVPLTMFKAKEVIVSFYSTFLSRANLELLGQTLLMLSFFFIAIPTSYSALSSTASFSTEGETDGGLSNLKVLLYEQTGLFLLLSTTVLLVALIGAAVMTRNKK